MAISMKWFRRHESLVILLLAATLLRIPSLFEPMWYGDEGIYLTIGQGLRRGLTLYRDIHDNKPPLLYWLAAVAGTQFWLRFMLLVWQTATLAVFYRLAQRLYPKHPLFPLLSTTLLILLITMFEGNIANGEIFMILPVIWGMKKVWETPTGLMSIFLAGVSLALGFLFKVPAGFDFAAALIFIILVKAGQIKDSLARLLKPQIWLLMAGFIIPIVLSIVYYQSLGAGEPYLKSALLQNIGYLGSWSGGSHSAAFSLTGSDLVQRTLLVILGISAVWYGAIKLKITAQAQFIAIWFILALYGALLPGRPYPHYLIQPAVPAALLIAMMGADRQRASRILVGSLLFIALYFYIKIDFWHYAVISYYRNFFAWVTERKSPADYFSYFHPTVPRTYQVAEFIATITNPTDKIFVWGDEPFIYALSDRLPSGRYTVAYHIVDFNGYEETITAINQDRPRVIVTFTGESRPFPQLFQAIAGDYTMVIKIDDAIIFLRSQPAGLLY